MTLPDYIIKNGLLAYDSPISSTKAYTQIANGHSFTHDDFVLPTYHKKQIKQLHRKDLGSKMICYYVLSRALNIFNKLNDQGVLAALSIFKYFDEDTGIDTHFLYQKSKKQTDDVQRLFTLLDIDRLWTDVCHTDVQKTTTFHLSTPQPIPTHDVQAIVSFLFVNVLLYGKLHIQNNTLLHAKIELPLFGQFMSYEQIFAEIQQYLYTQGIFINLKNITTANGKILQITINDNEILSSFANFYKSIEKLDGISMSGRIEHHKSLLKLENSPKFDNIKLLTIE